MSLGVKKKRVRTLICVTSDKRARGSLNEAAAEFREKRVTRAKNLWLDEAHGCPDAAAALWNARFPWGKEC